MNNILIRMLAGMMITCAGVAVCAFSPTPPVRTLTPAHKYLMLADSSVERAFSVEKRYHAAQRHGKPVLESTEPWMNRNVYIYGSVIHDRRNGVYRMWLLSVDRKSEPSIRVLYAESPDGYEWKHVMQGKELEGAKKSIVPGVFGHNASVVSLSEQDDGAPPYRAFWYNKRGRSIWTAVTEDGINFRDKRPVIALEEFLPMREDGILHGEDVFHFSYDRWAERFIGSFKCHQLAHTPAGVQQFRRSFILGESGNGFDWTLREIGRASCRERVYTKV